MNRIFYFLIKGNNLSKENYFDSKKKLQITSGT